MTAKATASKFKRPLLRLDAGRLLGGWVGQSENIDHSVIRTVEAIAPCVVWADQVEKGFSGSKGLGAADGETGAWVTYGAGDGLLRLQFFLIAGTGLMNPDEHTVIGKTGEIQPETDGIPKCLRL